MAIFIGLHMHIYPMQIELIPSARIVKHGRR